MKRFATTLALLLFLSPAVWAQTGEDLFQQALRTERLSGNMEAAIALYEQIVEEHVDDRDVSARALLQLARAYESLGRTEARRAYGRLVSEYADYPDMAAEARAAYERLAPKPEMPQPGTVSTLNIHQLASSWGAFLSPDGSVVGAPIYEMGGSGGYALHDLETGAATIAALNLGDEAGGPDFGALSPDGTKLAGTWFPDDSNRTTIRVRDLRSGAVTQVTTGDDVYRALKALEPEDGSAPYVEVYDWTSDGGSILLWYAFARGSHGLVLVHLDGAPLTPVAEFGEKGFYLRACITSDNRYVFAALSDSRVYIERFDLQTGERTTWRESDEQNVDMIGCVDGPSRVLFSEDFLGGKRILSARADEIEGEVEAHATVPANSHIGVPSRRGDVAYWPVNDWGWLTASVDSASMDLSSPLSSLGAVGISMWSPSGNRIAWVDREKSQTVLWHADAGSRTILNNPTAATPVAFSADGTTLKLQNDENLLYLNLESGDTEAVSKDLFENLGTGISLEPDRSGHEYAFTKDRDCLVRIDMNLEEGASLWCKEDGQTVGRFRVSPDYSKILVERWRGDEGGPGSLPRELVGITVVDAETGASQTLREGGKGLEGEPLGRATWAGNDKILVTGHPPENVTWLASAYLLGLETGELRSVLGSLFEQVAATGGIHMSHDRRHVIVRGVPREVGGDPSLATIIHRAAEVRLNR